MIGKVALCKQGKLGVIASVRIRMNDRLYMGVGLDGSKWQSTDPKVQYDCINEYVDAALNLFGKET